MLEKIEGIVRFRNKKLLRKNERKDDSMALVEALGLKNIVIYLLVI